MLPTIGFPEVLVIVGVMATQALVLGAIIYFAVRLALRAERRRSS